MNWLIGWAVLTASQPAIAGKDRCDRPADELAEVSETLKGLAAAEEQDAADMRDDKADRDKDRAKTAKSYAKKGWLCTPEDQFHAAWVMRHNSDADDLKIALDAATNAMNGHVPRANWLTAIVFDRHQVHTGQPQRYGSMMGTPEGKLCLYAIDESITDADRALYGMPPIQSQFKRVLEANSIREEATLREVKRRDLICPAVDPNKKGR